MEGRVGDVRVWRPGGLHCFGVVGVGYLRSEDVLQTLLSHILIGLS